MQENSNFSNTLTIKFLCFVSIIFALLDIIELQNIYDSWYHSIKAYKNNLVFLDTCIKFPLISKAVFTLFSFLSSLSAAFVTFLASINIDFFIDKCLLTFIFFNVNIYGPFMLFFSFYGMMNFDNIFYSCKSDQNSVKFFKQISTVGLMKTYDLTDFPQIQLSHGYLQPNRVNHTNNYVSFSNVFNLITTITISFLICLVFSLYETYDKYYCSILNKEGGNPLLGKLFWFIISKHKKFGINRRDYSNSNNNRNSTNIDRITNLNPNEETNLLVRNSNF